MLQAAACSRRVAVARLGRRGRGAGARSRPRSPGFGRLTSSLPCRGGSSWRRRWSSRSQHGGAAWGAEEKGEGGGVAGKKRRAVARALIARALGLWGRASILDVRVRSRTRGADQAGRLGREGLVALPPSSGGGGSAWEPGGTPRVSQGGARLGLGPMGRGDELGRWGGKRSWAAEGEGGRARLTGCYAGEKGGRWAGAASWARARSDWASRKRKEWREEEGFGPRE